MSPQDFHFDNLMEAVQGGLTPEHVRELAQQKIQAETADWTSKAQHAQQHPVRHALGGAAAGGLLGAGLGGAVGLPVGGMFLRPGLGAAIGAGVGGLGGAAFGATRGGRNIRIADEAAAAQQALQGSALLDVLRQHAQRMITEYEESNLLGPEDRKAAMRYLMAQAPKKQKLGSVPDELIASMRMEKVALSLGAITGALKGLGGRAVSAMGKSPALTSAALGAGVGAVGGAAAGGEGHRLSGALKGGALGGALGGAVGYAAPRVMGHLDAGHSLGGALKATGQEALTDVRGLAGRVAPPLAATGAVS